MGVSVTHSVVLSTFKEVIQHSHRRFNRFSQIMATHQTEVREWDLTRVVHWLRRNIHGDFFRRFGPCPFIQDRIRRRPCARDQTVVTSISSGQQVLDRGSAPVHTPNLCGSVSRPSHSRKFKRTSLKTLTKSTFSMMYEISRMNGTFRIGPQACRTACVGAC